mgnify:CR=1 FL=1
MRDVTARKIIIISYHNSNTGYARPETKGRIKTRDNKGKKIREDKGLEFSFSML